MRYWLVVISLILTFLFGLHSVANNVNRQLCLDAATVLDFQLSGDSVCLSALNNSCSLNIPGLTSMAGSAKRRLGTVTKEARQGLSNAADALRSYGETAADFLRDKGDHGEG